MESRWENKRINLVRGVPPNHVKDGKVTTRVIFNPRIDLEGMLVHDDDLGPFGNQLADILAGQDRIFPFGSDGGGGPHGLGWSGSGRQTLAATQVKKL